MPIHHPDIVVPASTSNLGSGFDALSVAVKLYTRVRLIERLPSSPGVVRTEFVDGPFSGENRIETAFQLARARFGVEVPGIRIEVQSDVPRRAGLGSSATATIAGLRLYEMLTAPLPVPQLLGLAAEVEGHPDNAAAAVLGGITASCQCDDGHVMALSWRWPPDIRLIVGTPDVPLDTSHARTVLPKSMDLQDAVFNLQRAVLLVRALECGDYGVLREAMRDRWHQPFRAPLVPALAEALALEHPSLLGVCLSGAGPSILALAAGQVSEVATLIGTLYDRLSVPHTIRILEAHQPEDAGTAGAVSARSSESVTRS
jgi:homoserine kinase